MTNLNSRTSTSQVLARSAALPLTREQKVTTPDQILVLIKIARDAGRERTQQVFDSSILADVFGADYNGLDRIAVRNAFRAASGQLRLNMNGLPVLATIEVGTGPRIEGQIILELRKTDVRLSSGGFLLVKSMSFGLKQIKSAYIEVIPFCPYEFGIGRDGISLEEFCQLVLRETEGRGVTYCLSEVGFQILHQCREVIKGKTNVHIGMMGLNVSQTTVPQTFMLQGDGGFELQAVGVDKILGPDDRVLFMSYKK